MSQCQLYAGPDVSSLKQQLQREECLTAARSYEYHLKTGNQCLRMCQLYHWQVLHIDIIIDKGNLHTTAFIKDFIVKYIIKLFSLKKYVGSGSYCLKPLLLMHKTYHACATLSQCTYIIAYLIMSQ